MANGVSVLFDHAALDRVLGHLAEDIERAIMYSLRETGRGVIHRAQQSVTVYSGDDERAIPGRLRDAIVNAHKIDRVAGHTYTMRVGVLGGGILNAYKTQEEARTHYMARAVAATQAADVFTRAIGLTIERAARGH